MNAFVVYGVKYFVNTARFFVGPPKKNTLLSLSNKQVSKKTKSNLVCG